MDSSKVTRATVAQGHEQHRILLEIGKNQQPTFDRAKQNTEGEFCNFHGLANSSCGCHSQRNINNNNNRTTLNLETKKPRHILEESQVNHPQSRLLNKLVELRYNLSQRFSGQKENLPNKDTDDANRGSNFEIDQRNTTAIDSHEVTDTTRPMTSQVESRQEARQMALNLTSHLGSSCSSYGTSRSTIGTNTSSGFISDTSEFAIRDSLGERTSSSSYDGSYDNHTDRVDHTNFDHRGYRSKLIDDLDRLLTGAKRSGSSSPSELEATNTNQRSSSAESPSIAEFNPMTDTNQNREFDYSTLCRDEFSSFIATAHQMDTNSRKPKRKTNLRAKRRHKNGSPNEEISPYSGPMLVGVHENLEPTMGLPDESKRLMSESCSTLTWSSADSSASAGANDKSLSDESVNNEQTQDQCIDSDIIEDTNGPLKIVTHLDSVDGGRSSGLGEMLDVYLKRVESLLRIIEGDSSVSMSDAYGEDTNMEVSEELKTKIEFVPLKRPNDRKVIQQITTTDMIIDEEDDVSIGKVRNVNDDVSVTTENYRLNLNLVQNTTPQLNWIHLLEDCELTTDLLESKRRKHLNFEELLYSLMDNLICNNKGETDAKLADKNSLRTLRKHLKEFIERYQLYQEEFHKNTTFSSDWHENWYFSYDDFKANEEFLAERASDNPNERSISSNKRAKMTDQIENRGRCIQSLDLIKYSTLILSRCRAAAKLAYLAREPFEQSDIDKVYEAQDELLEEKSPRRCDQLDACEMLIYDLDFSDYAHDDARNSSAKLNSKRQRNSLLVNYNSSLQLTAKTVDSSLNFSAYGYHFEPQVNSSLSRPLNNLKSTRRRRKFHENILNRIFTMIIQSDILNFAPDSSCRARFLVKLENVELVNELPIIQFCAKISGSLPIYVRWFRSEEEIGELSIKESPVIDYRCIRVRERLIDESVLGEGVNSWPLGMRATYDYEYKTKWSSLFRFKRSHGDIIFEIREPKLSHDYGQIYRCSIQNYCSRDECFFKLSRRQVESDDSEKMQLKLDHQVKLVNQVNSKLAKETTDRHAILRTWSQRTLHRPQPQTDDRMRERLLAEKSLANDLSHENGDKDDTSNRRQQTVGRLSSSRQLVDADKFGKDFPYHPENLLRRLEENKFCSVSVSGTRCKSTKGIEARAQVIGEFTGCQSELNANVSEINESHTSKFRDSFEPLENSCGVRSEVSVSSQTKVDEIERQVETGGNNSSLNRLPEAAANSSIEVEEVKFRASATREARFETLECNRNRHESIQHREAQVNIHSDGQPEVSIKELSRPTPRMRATLYNTTERKVQANPAANTTGVSTKPTPSNSIQWSRSDDSHLRQVNSTSGDIKQTCKKPQNHTFSPATIQDRLDKTNYCANQVPHLDERHCEGSNSSSRGNKISDLATNRNHKQSSKDERPEATGDRASVKSLISRFNLA